MMSLPRLYLETTIPSYLTARPSRDIAVAGQQELTRRWWNECRGDYELCVSQLIESEASRGDAEMVAARMAALHIGVATVHRVEYLLTWNCRHIRNPHTMWQIARLCTKLGYDCPRICTPDDLL